MSLCCMRLYMLINTSFELNNYGYEECLPQKSFGPAIRDHHLFHYIFKGRGIFEVDNDGYDVEEGQMFVICPNDVTFYKADKSDPWIYSWIGFSGEGTKELINYLGISKNDPIIDIPGGSKIKDILWELSLVTSINIQENFKCISLMYRFISELVSVSQRSFNTSSSSIQNSYVFAVENFIQNNYQNDIKVSDISKMIGLDRSYLSSLFKKTNNKSIQEYLIDHRLRKGMYLIRETDLTILQIAMSIGYADQFIFSKAFKKKYGIPPSRYRQMSF